MGTQTHFRNEANGNSEITPFLTDAAQKLVALLYFISVTLSPGLLAYLLSVLVSPNTMLDENV